MNRTPIRLLMLLPIVLLALVALFLILRPDPTGVGGSQEARIDLKITEGAMTPDKIAVEDGDRVVLRVTSDRPVGLHVHGYDLEEEVEPGEPTEMSFEATITGRFEIEDHDTEAVLGVLVVRPR